MSVMACSRSCCQNIMCSRLIDGQAYICEDCYRELLNYKLIWPTKMNKSEVWDRIQTFMSSKVNSLLPIEGEEIEEEFNRLITE